MPTFKQTVDKLIESARSKGAKSAKLIPTKDVVVEDYVRRKCQFGCKMYAKRFCCPPYTPTPEETRRSLKNYSDALLIEYAGLGGVDEQRKVNEKMVELEREAFLGGLYKASIYIGGPCRYCATCPAEDVQYPSSFSKRECKNPLKARPSMESCGIEVYKTVRKAGFKIDVVKSGEPYRSFMLLLLR